MYSGGKMKIITYSCLLLVVLYVDVDEMNHNVLLGPVVGKMLKSLKHNIPLHITIFFELPSDPNKNPRYHNRQELMVAIYHRDEERGLAKNRILIPDISQLLTYNFYLTKLTIFFKSLLCLIIC